MCVCQGSIINCSLFIAITSNLHRCGSEAVFYNGRRDYATEINRVYWEYVGMYRHNAQNRPRQNESYTQDNLWSGKNIHI